MRIELLSLHNVAKSLGGHQIFPSISLRLYREEIVFLIGAANSGKSLMARIIMGALQPDSGRMFWLGEPYAPKKAEHAHKKGIFYVSPSMPLMQNLTIAENISLARSPKSLICRHYTQMFAKARVICDDYRLCLDVYRKAEGLTRMEALEVYCARAIFNGAKLLIFDNMLPTLSDAEAGRFFQLASAMKGRGITMLFLESSMQHCIRYGDRSMFIFDGRITVDLPRKELTEEALDTLNTRNLLFLARLPYKEAASAETQTFYCDPSGGTRLRLKAGKVYGLSCRKMEVYQWYLDSFFNTELVCRLNNASSRNRVRVLTMQQLQNWYFPDLTFWENILLPIFPQIARGCFFHPGRAERFFLGEIAPHLHAVPSSQWGRKAFRLGNLEKEIAALYRTMLEQYDILVFSGITDYLNPPLFENLQQVIKLAIERKKCVVLYSRNRGLLESWCGQTILLDELENS